MSIFRCSRCDQYKDSDYIGCEEDPKHLGELMCPEHAEDDEDLTLDENQERGAQ